MAKILILAPSGFGKSTGIGPSAELGIEGLDPKESYIISVTSKALPFRGSEKLFPSAKSKGVPVKIEDLRGTSRFISNDAKRIAEVLALLKTNPRIKTIVIDDTNYIMQDYYMDNALKTGWDAPKKVGYDMGVIFKALEGLEDRNIIVMGHYQMKPLAADESRVEYTLKTTGKMVDEYLTPGGKFDICLIGKTGMETGENNIKKVVKFYVTNDDGETAGAKSAPGMFPPTIINDLGLVVKKVNEYYAGEAPVVQSDVASEQVTPVTPVILSEEPGPLA